MTYVKEEILAALQSQASNDIDCENMACERCKLQLMLAQDPEFDWLLVTFMTYAGTIGLNKALAVMYANAIILGAALAETRILKEIYGEMK